MKDIFLYLCSKELFQRCLCIVHHDFVCIVFGYNGEGLSAQMLCTDLVLLIVQAVRLICNSKMQYSLFLLELNITKYNLPTERFDALR